MIWPGALDFGKMNSSDSTFSCCEEYNTMCRKTTMTLYFKIQFENFSSFPFVLHFKVIILKLPYWRRNMQMEKRGILHETTTKLFFPYTLSCHSPDIINQMSQYSTELPISWYKWNCWDKIQNWKICCWC